MDKQFVFNKNEFLRHVTFDEMLRCISGGFADDGWEVIVKRKGEILGEYKDGKLVEGYWFNEEHKTELFDSLYTSLKECARNDGQPFKKWLDRNAAKFKLSIMDYAVLQLLDDQGEQMYHTLYVCDKCGFRTEFSDMIDEHVECHK